MLDRKAQSQFAQAAADLMRVCAFAGTRVAHASARQGMALWMRTLQLSALRADARSGAWWRSSPLPWSAWSAAFERQGQSDPQPDRVPPSSPAQAAADPAFASYRTAGGHATAQIVMGGDPA